MGILIIVLILAVIFFFGCMMLGMMLGAADVAKQYNARQKFLAEQERLYRNRYPS